MTSDKQFDLVVIGSGPGGYVAAARAAQLGLNTAIVEKDEPGGVCLNWGCIPSKNLIHQAAGFAALKDMADVGVGIDKSTLSYERVHAGSRKVVSTLTSGVSGLMKRRGVEWVAGRARLKSPREVLLDDGSVLAAKAILLATGSHPLEVPGFEFDEQAVLSSTGILQMTDLPRSLVILGGGAIGCEFAFVMQAFGAEVVLVEAMPQLLPNEDEACAKALADSFKQKGIEVLTSTRAESIAKGNDGVTVTLMDSNGESMSRSAEKALVVFGRAPNTRDLGLDAVGVRTDAKGYVEVSEYQQTSVPGVFAIGDITSTPALAHVASKEGEIVAEYLAGCATLPRIDAELVPSAVYCEPQVAGFGVSESQALERELDFKVSTFSYPGAGKSIAIGKPDGFVKVLTDRSTGELLGAHIIGHDATELIHELLLAKQSELLPEDIGHMIHAHPTLSEVVMEVMRDVNDSAIHK